MTALTEPEMTPDPELDLGKAVPETMSDQESIDFWADWVAANPARDPFLTSLIPRWDQLIGYDPAMMGPREMTDPIYWAEMAPEIPDDQRMIEQCRAELAEAMSQALNHAAFKELVGLTIHDGAAVEMSGAQLDALIDQVTEPLARVALTEGMPVNRATQVTWLMAWWIQDPAPTVVPTPPFAKATLWAYPAPPWEPAQAPRPEWMRQMLAAWARHRAATARP
ncbi:hypothetical protein ABXS69_04230 [Actinomyces timonensis]|uniref:Uncharacterized protein n=1 Tax=Actinomyces timonensis TaxID=1288391 RepID=A0AAU8N5G5_9ACTO